MNLDNRISRIRKQCAAIVDVCKWTIPFLTYSTYEYASLGRITRLADSDNHITVYSCI